MFGDSTERIHDKGLASYQFHHAQHPVQYAIVARDLLWLSASRVKGSRCSVANSLWESTSSTLMPRITAPASRNAKMLSRNSQASVVAARCAVLRIEVEHDPFARDSRRGSRACPPGPARRMPKRRRRRQALGEREADGRRGHQHRGSEHRGQKARHASCHGQMLSAAPGVGPACDTLPCGNTESVTQTQRRLDSRPVLGPCSREAALVRPIRSGC